MAPIRHPISIARIKLAPEPVWIIFIGVAKSGSIPSVPLLLLGSALIMVSCRRGTETRHEIPKESPRQSGLPAADANKSPVGGRGGEVDPVTLTTPQLIARLEALYRPDATSSDYIRAIEELAKRDPRLVLDNYFTKDRIANFAGFPQAVDNLAKRDPEFLKSWLADTLPTLTSRKDLLEICYRMGITCLARTQPDEALALATRTIKDPNLRLEAIGGVFWTLGAADPDKALAAARAGYTGRQLDLLLSRIAFGAVETQPARALEIATSITNSQDRASTTARIFSQWLARDPEAVMQRVADLPAADFEKVGRSAMAEQNTFITTMAETRPDLLVEKMGNVTTVSSNLALFQRSIDALMAVDHDKAMAVLDNLPAGPMKEELIGTTWRDLAADNLDPAMIRDVYPDDPAARASAIRGFATAAGLKGMDSILALSKDLPATDREVFLTEAIPSVKADDLSAVSAMFLRDDANLAELSPEKRAQVTSGIGARMAIVDPDAALAWYARIPANQQADAMSGMAHEMIGTDANAFATWLTAQPRNPAWTVGARELIAELDNSDPATAAQWRKALDEK